jgi:pimeloyl-ACP methyl ester carboxylesterase
MNYQAVKVNNLDLHYSVAGSGTPLLLLHGWTQTARFWEPYIKDLSQNFTVYAIDLRGHGRSGIADSDFSIQLVSNDLEQFIHQLKLDKVNVIGLSYGGLVALNIMKNNGSLIHKAIVIGVAPQFNGRERWKDSPAVDVDKLDKGFMEYLQSQHLLGEVQIRSLFRKDLNYQISLSEADMNTITSEVLIINGDRDEVVGLDGALQLYRHLPKSELWIVPGKPHLAIDETNQNEFLKTVLRFMQ